MMDTLTNSIRISALPSYVKTATSRKILPELNCYWSSEHRSYPFVLAITGNIATAETFPYERNEYLRIGLQYHFPARFLSSRRSYHGLDYVFDIVENKKTGEQMAILLRVTRSNNRIRG